MPNCFSMLVTRRRMSSESMSMSPPKNGMSSAIWAAGPSLRSRRTIVFTRSTICGSAAASAPMVLMCFESSPVNADLRALDSRHFGSRCNSRANPSLGDFKHDLAAGVAGLAVLPCFLGMRKREGVHDLGAQFPGVEQLAELHQSGGRRFHLHHQGADLVVRGLSLFWRLRRRHQPPALREHFERARPGPASQPGKG